MTAEVRGGTVGPPGPPGVVAADPPATYDPAAQTVGLAFGSGLMLDGDQLILDPAVAAATTGAAPAATTRPVAKPATYGAVGTGLVDDTDALLAALATGLDVEGDEGATYLVRPGELVIPDWRTLDLNWATIKRKAQVVTSTDTDVSPLTTSYLLASTAGLAVGDHVTFANSTVARGLLVPGTSSSDNQPRIMSIVGNTINLDVGPNCTFTATAVVATSGQTVQHGNGTTVRRCRWDGNKANHSWIHWSVIGEVFSETTRILPVTEDIKFSNLPGEGYQMRGQYPLFQRITADELNGNLVHMAATDHPTIDTISSVNCNLDTGMGHVTGHITFSSTITHAVVNNIYTVGGRSGVGGLNENDSDHLFSNMHIHTAFYTGIDAVGIGSAGNHTFTNVHLHNCGPAGATNGGMDLQGITGSVTLNGVEFWGCDLNINSVSNADLDIKLHDGARINSTLFNRSKVKARFSGTTRTSHCIDISAGTGVSWDIDIDQPNDTTSTMVKCGSCTDYTLKGEIKGGLFGLVGTSTANINLDVGGLKCSGQVSRAMSLGSATGTYRADGAELICTAAGVNWIGLNISGLGVKGAGVKVRRLAGQADYGVRIFAKAKMSHLLVDGTFDQKPVQITAGSTGSVIHFASLPAAVHNLGTDSELKYIAVEGEVAAAGAKYIAARTVIAVGGATSVDVSAYDVVDATFTASAPVALTNFVAGDAIEFVLRQDALGGRVATFTHATLPFKSPGGAAATFTTTPGDYDRVVFEHTGTEISVTLIGKKYG